MLQVLLSYLQYTGVAQRPLAKDLFLMDQWIQLQKDDLVGRKRLHENQILDAALMLGAYNHFKILLIIAWNSKEHLQKLSSLNISKLKPKLLLLWAFSLKHIPSTSYYSMKNILHRWFWMTKKSRQRMITDNKYWSWASHHVIRPQILKSLNLKYGVM